MKNRVLNQLVLLTSFLLSAGIHAPRYCAADERDDRTIALAGGKVLLKAPDSWTRTEPKFKGIASDEFVVRAVEGDVTDGRVTVGSAGGGVEQNFSRWMSQYQQPDGTSTVDRAVRKRIQLSGQDVHYLDISGTYQPPPFLGEPPQPDFRMLGAIIVTQKQGSYYVRFYGPHKTVEANERAFKNLIDSLEIKE